MKFSKLSLDCREWKIFKVTSTISTLLDVTFDLLWDLATLCRISEFVASIGKVKSLPEECLSSGRTLHNPGQSSVTNEHLPVSTFCTSARKQTSERLPRCRPIGARDIPSTDLHSHKVFFFHSQNARTRQS